MIGKYKVSVIIPVYNSQNYIEECLQSIVMQTLNSIEIVIVNDGSTDGSLKIIEKFERKYNNIKVITQENLGVVKARITGYKNATGEYIGWVDSDDFVEKNMYEKLYNKAIEKNSDIVICNYKFYPYNPSKKIKWFKNFTGQVDYNFIEKNTIQWNKLVKREFLEKVNIVDLFKKIGEGAYSIVLINTDKIATIDEELYNYRVGHESLSSNYKDCNWYEKNIIKEKNKLDIIINTSHKEKWQEYFEYLLFYSYILMLIIAINNNKKSLYNKYCKEMKKAKYNKNKYAKEILTKEQGKLKAFVLLKIIPNSYYISLPIVKIFLNIK